MAARRDCPEVAGSNPAGASAYLSPPLACGGAKAAAAAPGFNRVKTAGRSPRLLVPALAGKRVEGLRARGPDNPAARRTR